MPSLKKHTARDRVLRLGQAVVDELNRPGQQQLVRLLELWRAFDAAPFVFRDTIRGGKRWIDVVPDKARTRLQKELNNQLALYQFRREVQFRDDGEFPVAEVLVGRRANSPSFLREAQAVGRFLRLAELGEWGRVRPCPICQQWFMAARPDAVYCGTRCARRKARQVLKETGKAAAYKRFSRKRQPLQDRIDQLKVKRDRGRHLSTHEKSELAELEAKVEKLKRKYERRRRRSHVKK